MAAASGINHHQKDTVAMSHCYWSMPNLPKVNGLGQGTRGHEIGAAREFFQQHGGDVSDGALGQTDQHLWHLWQQAITQDDTATQLAAELCLRCRIAHEIRTSCRDLAARFQDQQVTWEEVFTCLPYDDGQSLERLQGQRYQPFTLTVLHVYNPQRNGQASLAKLVQRMVRQHESVLQYLLDQGVLLRSDWALLNRARLAELTTFEAAILKAFHAVYRSDRRQQHTSRTDGKCPPPTTEQLQRMLAWLKQKKDIQIDSPAALLKHLTSLANVIRKQEIFKKRKTPWADGFDLSDSDSEAGASREIADESIFNNPFEAVAQKTFQTFCDRWQQQGWNFTAELDTSLVWGVEQAIRDRVTDLNRKSKQNPQVERYEQGLYLTYCQGLTQTEIGNQWQMDQYKVSTLLKLKELNQQQIPDHTVEKLFRQIVQRIQTLELSIHTSTPEYKQDLVPLLSQLLAPIVAEAEAERRNPKTRQRTSRLATHIQTVLKNRRSQAS
jgi:hypothetical protein